MYKLQEAKNVSEKNTTYLVLNDPINYLLSQFHLKIVNLVSKSLRKAKNLIKKPENKLLKCIVIFLFVLHGFQIA